MTAIDPYRTLEIAPGASQAEVKRAYRRLAKLYHPDSAGERALSRFLSIQAAYEMLVDEPGRPRTVARGPAARPGPAPAWQADASRARATREAYRARTRRGAGASSPAGSTGPAGGPPGRRDGSSPGSDRADGDGASGGGARSTRASGAGTGGSSDTAGGAGGAAGSSTGSRTRRSGRRTKATIGSTSYDGADREPFDPAWEGATWYGAGSGTYWTINPKEYADPRKHGPEYLARSRRATGASAESTAPGDVAPPGMSEAEADTGPTTRTTSDTTTDATSRGGPGDTGTRRPRTAHGPSHAAPVGSSAGDPRTGPHAEPPTVAPRPVRRSAAPQGPLATAAGVAGSPEWPGSSDLQRAASTPPGRIVVALVGWIPFAVALAALTQAVPVCRGVGAVCDDPLTGGVLIVDLAVIALLVAIPRLGWIAAIGSLAFFIVGIIATPVLLALGGTQTPTGTSSALSVVLVVAWLGGIALALSGRIDLPPWRHGRVR